MQYETGPDAVEKRSKNVDKEKERRSFRYRINRFLIVEGLPVGFVMQATFLYRMIHIESICWIYLRKPTVFCERTGNILLQNLKILN